MGKQVEHVRIYGYSGIQSRGNSAYFSDVATSAWCESSKTDADSRDGQSPDARSLGHTFQMKDDEREDRARELSPCIDNEKYVVYKIARLNRIAVRWRNREKINHMGKFKEVARSVGQIPRCRTMYGIRTSEISNHGMAECIKRAQDCQVWHSIVVWQSPRARLPIAPKCLGVWLV